MIPLLKLDNVSSLDHIVSSYAHFQELNFRAMERCGDQEGHQYGSTANYRVSWCHDRGCVYVIALKVLLSKLLTRTLFIDLMRCNEHQLRREEEVSLRCMNLDMVLLCIATSPTVLHDSYRITNTILVSYSSIIQEYVARSQTSRFAMSGFVALANIVRGKPGSLPQMQCVFNRFLVAYPTSNTAPEFN